MTFFLLVHIFPSQTYYILPIIIAIVIDPENGKVIARYDMRKLLKSKDRYGGEDCLNGIAFDKRTGIAYFTGKLYQHVYKLKLDNFGKINNDL